MAMLSKGLAGEPVELLQKKLDIDVDGAFGPNTEAALKKFQEKNGLTADGLAGPATLSHMKLFKEITAETVQMSQVPASRIPIENSTQSSQENLATANAGGPSVRSIWDTIKNAFN